MSQKFDIIMFNMSEWQDWYKKGIVNRNYHVLHNLLKHPKVNQVLAIDFLPYTKKRALKSYIKNQRMSVGGKTLKKDLTSKLTQLANNFFVYSTVDSIFSEEKVYSKIKRLIQYLDLQNIILWSYFPMFVGYFDKFNSKIKIFDAVDNWIEHPSFSEYKIRLEKNYKIIEEKADFIFTVSKELTKLFSKNKNTHWIPNGVDVEYFQQSTIDDQQSAADSTLKQISKPIIGYVGIIQNRVDIPLIKYLAEKSKDKSIVLIGPTWKELKSEISNLKSQNIYFLGHKPYKEVPAYIQQFDVAIIPHIVNKFTNSMNPLKLYEYLACGKPIVTTPVIGTEEFKNLIEIAQNKEEFDEKIKKVLMEDQKELAEKRIEAVRKYSWKNKVNKMMSYITVASHKL